MNLRPYQEKAIASVKNDYLKGHRQLLLSMATGTGKTVVFSKMYNELADVLPGKMLVLAHRDELLNQAIDKISSTNRGVTVGKEMAESYADPNSDIVVASTATLGRKNTPRLDVFPWQQFDKFIVDEAHHSVASTYLNIFERTGVLLPDSQKLLLGVTATPSRGDGQALAKIYKKISYSYSILDAIQDGWLVDLTCYRVKTNVSLDDVKTVAGDFAVEMLADKVNNPARNSLVVKAWADHALTVQTVAFTVDIQHAKDLAEAFRSQGHRAEAIWGDDPDRALKLQRHKNKEITILTNCGVLTEGYDDWRIGCIVLARPTKSSTLFTQMVGRGTRLQDGTGNLKEFPDPSSIKHQCIIIDVVDTSYKHSLVTLPTLFGMNGELELAGTKVTVALKMLQDAATEYSHLDFSQLKDINQLKSYIEKVNLFEIKYPDIVTQNSTLGWHGAPDGGFILVLQNKESVTIKQNVLDQWELSATINGKKFKGVRDSINEIFVVADDLVLKELGGAATLIKQKAKWHDDPATQGQLDFLAKIYRGKMLPENMTKGKASMLISQFKARKSVR